MEEIYDSQRWASWALFDNRKTEALKNKIDVLAKNLATEDKNVMIEIIEKSLAYYHNTSNNEEIAQLTSPYVDAYDLFMRISTTDWKNSQISALAKAIATNIEAATLASYYGSGYFPDSNRFKNNKNGIAMIVPLGHKTYSGSNRSFWAHNNWYSPSDQSHTPNAFGQYQWCQDNATPDNGEVENWFEYLDYIFDVKDGKGGVNAYKY